MSVVTYINANSYDVPTAGGMKDGEEKEMTTEDKARFAWLSSKFNRSTRRHISLKDMLASSVLWSMDKFEAAPKWLQFAMLVGALALAMAIIMFLLLIIELAIQTITIWIAAFSATLALLFYFIASALQIVAVWCGCLWAIKKI